MMSFADWDMRIRNWKKKSENSNQKWKDSKLYKICENFRKILQRKFLPKSKKDEKICILKPKNQENRNFRLCMKEQFKAVLFLFFDVLWIYYFNKIYIFLKKICNLTGNRYHNVVIENTIHHKIYFISYETHKWLSMQTLTNQETSRN